ncbi:3'-5' exonuclease [Spiractinospora alimapuensis]|uniref:3'-5' exonuclease n=1 Tax=Spiractinospora alimapuensis TaxID=2820884 RepID=UPI001F4254AB|nr:3'-5' exonuclease [Spiractinospora alimapuensis]
MTRAPHDRWQLRRGALRRGGGTDPRRLQFAVVDFETTGLRPDRGARVCEFAVVRVRGDGAVLGEASTLVNPGVPIDGTPFHGLTDADVYHAPTVSEVLASFSTLISGAVVVAHNLDFEERFLSRQFGPAGLPTGLAGLCTLRTLRAQVDLSRYSLPRASEALGGWSPTHQHTALGDARATARLLVELIANAPGRLSYRGPSPVSLHSRSGAARLVPREGPPAPDGDLPRGPWVARWRPQEFDQALCGGSFLLRARAEAQAQALRAERRRRITAYLARFSATSALTAATAAAINRHRLRRGCVRDR